MDAGHQIPTLRSLSVVSTVSAVVPNPSRERSNRWWDPSKRLINSIRDYQRMLLKRREASVAYAWTFSLRSKFAVIRHRFWSVITGSDIPLNANLGRGLLLPHPNGIVIHPDAIIGPNCLIFQQVTIGTGTKPGLPRIGGHVDIGAGAKILGGITIGAHSVIGANAVVTKNVPAHSVATGIPARFRPR